MEEKNIYKKNAINKKIIEQDLQTDRMTLASKRSRKFIAVFVPSEACGSLYAEQGDL